MPLTEDDVKNSKPGKISDGGGLYLHTMPNGSRYWRLAYRFGGKQKLLALGVYHENKNNIEKARELREAARELLARNIDPSEARKTEKADKRILKDLRKRVNDLYRHSYTCRSSRHLYMVAEKFAKGETALIDNHKHLAITILSVLELVWTARRYMTGLNFPNAEIKPTNILEGLCHASEMHLALRKINTWAGIARETGTLDYRRVRQLTMKALHRDV